MQTLVKTDFKTNTQNFVKNLSSFTNLNISEKVSEKFWLKNDKISKGNYKFKRMKSDSTFHEMGKFSWEIKVEVTHLKRVTLTKNKRQVPQLKCQMLSK